MKRFAVAIGMSVLASGAWPTSAHASAFMIDVLISKSSGGGSHAARGILGLGGTGSTAHIPSLTLGALKPGQDRVANGTLEGSGQAESVHQIVAEARSVGSNVQPIGWSVGGTHSPGQIPSGAIANLNLGDGDYLTVSETVSRSIENAGVVSNLTGGPIESSGYVTGGSDSVSGGGANGSLPGSGNVGPDAVIAAVLPIVATGIVSFPDEMAGSLPGAGGETGLQVDPIAAPEPGSLLLLGSGLAVAARWLRGRKRRSIAGTSIASPIRD